MHYRMYPLLPSCGENSKLQQHWTDNFSSIGEIKSFEETPAVSSFQTGFIQFLLVYFYNINIAVISHSVTIDKYIVI